MGIKEGVKYCWVYLSKLRFQLVFPSLLDRSKVK